MKNILNTVLFLSVSFLSNLLFAQKGEFKYYISGNEENMKILNQKGLPITNETFTYVGDFSEGLCPVEKNKKFGFINKNGKIVIPYLYDYAYKMIKGVAVVQINKKYGLIDKKGNYIISPELEDISYDNLEFGLITFKKNSLFGVMKKNKKIIISDKFESIGKFENGYAVAKNRGKCGVIDRKGNTIIPFNYYYIGGFSNGASLTYMKDKNSKMGLMNIKEKVLLNPEYDNIYASKDKMVYLEKGKNKGLSDKNGRILFPTEYRNDGEKFSEGLMVLAKNKKVGFANTKGEIVIPLIYDGADKFSEGLAPVLKDGKWGFINSKGETVIDFIFVGVMQSFKDGFASYGKRNFSSISHYTSDLCGLIDKKGHVVIQNKYDSATNGYNGNFIVEIDGKKLLINKKEEVIAVLMREGPFVIMECRP